MTTAGLVTPALVGGGVLLGGWLTGGRGKAWAPFAGAYIGAASCGLIGGILYAAGSNQSGIESIGFMFLAPIIIVPVVILAGAVIGYELSEKSETDRLKSEHDKLMQAPTKQRSVPIMIQLYSGTF